MRQLNSILPCFPRVVRALRRENIFVQAPDRLLSSLLTDIYVLNFSCLRYMGQTRQGLNSVLQVPI